MLAIARKNQAACKHTKNQPMRLRMQLPRKPLSLDNRVAVGVTTTLDADQASVVYSMLPFHLRAFAGEGPRGGVQQQLFLALLFRDVIDLQVFEEVHTAFAGGG